MRAAAGATKLYLAGLGLLVLALLVFVQAAFNLGPFLSPSLPRQIVLLYTLSTFIFLVLIIFAFILARSMLKLWIERRTGRPGAQFKTRLVLSMIGLMLIPATFLFLFAFGLVNRSIDKWFSSPVDTIFQATDRIETEWITEHVETAHGILSQLALNPPEDLDRAARDFRLDLLALVEPDGAMRRHAGADEMSELTDRIRSELANSGVPAEPVLFDVNGRLVGLAPTGQGGAVAAVFRASVDLDELTTTVARERLNFQELRQNQRFYRDTYVYVLVLITVLVLFAAVWTGMFLSKRITVPIEALSGATREISQGNFSHRVRVEADDELGMLVGLFNDMAGRIELTTEELDERRLYTETILESIPTAVISLDQERRITKINQAARTMFSIDHPATLADVFLPDDLEQIEDLLRVCRLEGTATREMTLETPDRPAHGAVIASPLQPGGFVLAVEDLTDVVKAQKANAWREVARQLAHEIKNPLTPIQLSAERIARNLERLPTDARTADVIRECVESIVGEVDSLKDLVNEFGRVAKLPAVSRRPASIREVVERTLALYEGRDNGVGMEWTAPEDLPPVLMDPRQIKRVLINLIDNAMEAMAEVEPKQLRIECGLVRGGTMARLTVTDTGRGIAPEDRGHLFAPYFSTRRNGTGLGLAIASRIVADHGGYIGEESSHGSGARFILELPVCES